MTRERRRNPFTSSGRGGRTLSAIQLPLFLLLPPSGFGVLTTTGRKSGKPRRRCVRAIRRGDKAYLVAIKGQRTGWAKNALANPEVRLRIRGGTFDGVARGPRDEAERREAIEAYCETVKPGDYPEFALWQTGRPTPEKIKRMLRGWFERGTPFVVELITR